MTKLKPRDFLFESSLRSSSGCTPKLSCFVVTRLLHGCSFVKGIFSILLLLTSLTFVNQAVQAKNRAVLVEIFYLPHRPAEAVVTDIERLVAKFPGVEMKKFSFEDPANGKLLKKYGLTAHMPVAVFIDGKNEFTLEGRSFHLKNFPKGNAFVPMFEGSWTYQDIETILKTEQR